MMQTANVKKVPNQELAITVINQAVIQNTENAKVKVDNVVELTKSQRFSRFLEAYSDCVWVGLESKSTLNQVIKTVEQPFVN